MEHEPPHATRSAEPPAGRTTADEAMEILKACNRDIEVLSLARAALRAQPEGLQTGRSFSRVLVVITMNAFDVAFKVVKTTHPGLHAAYDAKSTPNHQRVELLSEALEHCEVRPDREIIADFFAMKELRNTLAHGGWGDGRRDRITARGIDTNMQRFPPFDGRDNWARLLEVASRMVEYLLHALVLTSATMTGDLVTHALSDLGIASGTEPSFVDFLVDPRHPANHARRTLEAIHNALVEERVRGDEVHAVAELATACAEAIVLAAPSDLDRTRQLFDDLTAGGVAWSRPIGLPLETLLDDVSAMALFRPFHDAARASGATVRGQVWQASVPDTVAIEFVRLAAPRVVDPRQLVAALRSGYAASDLLPNAAGTDALRRLRQRAPVTEQLAHAMKALLTVYEAGRAWRSWVGS